MSRDLDSAKAALAAVLASPKWNSMGGLSEDTIYGELAIDVALAAISAEREACAKIADDEADRAYNNDEERMYCDEIAAAIRARKTD